MVSVFLLLAIPGTIFLCCLARRFFHQEVVVDNCLSGRHGSFDYSNMTCDLQENHPYVSYNTRHPYHRALTEGSAALVVLSLLGFALTKSLRNRVE